MEIKNLITRKPHPIDRRSVLIHLTELGKKHRASSKAAVMKFNDKVLEVIGSESLENFHNVIENINEIIETRKVF
tara:strand:+ start:52 stop:276 length:225 start_codon:yes stop_codon:yes gene_type:complete